MRPLSDLVAQKTRLQSDAGDLFKEIARIRKIRVLEREVITVSHVCHDGDAELACIQDMAKLRRPW